MNKPLTLLMLTFFLVGFFVQPAASLQPTRAQIEKFNRMSAAEKKALAESMGVDITNVVGPGRIEEPIIVPQIPQPRNPDQAQTKAIEKSIVQENKSDEQKLSEDQEERSVKKALKQFGYELFAGDPSTFAPVGSIPVPLNYVVGPGDTVIIQLYGKESGVHEITINREGVLQFPGIGPLSVNGLNFKELKQQIQDVVKQQMIGLKANISMGPLRSMQIFVLGEAYRPGSYIVSSLSTMTNVLFVSGGVTKVGSLRNISLKRNGKVVSTLDLYDLLLKGDTSKDARLLPGDVLFIPPIGKTVGISGEVRRPAIYELKESATAIELVRLAGGYLPTAYPSASRIDRILDKGSRTFLDLDLSRVQGKNIEMKDGDLIQVYSILDRMDDAILISGHVNRPGGYQWKPGLRISDFIVSVNDLLPDPDLNYALIKRETKPSRTISTLKVDLGKAIRNPKSNYDVELKPRDELIVFGHSQERRFQIGKLITTIENQQEIGMYPEVVSIKGNVRYPGKYPLNEGMIVEDLIMAAGGYLPETDTLQGLLVFQSPKTSSKKVSSISFRDLTSLKQKLEPKSELIVLGLNKERESLLGELLDHLQKQASRSEAEEIVSIGGSVKFPGNYPFTRNMTLSELINLAGGLKESAYLLKAEVTRQYVSKTNEFSIKHLVVENEIGENLGDQYFLQIKDQIVVKRIPNWGEQKLVTLSGEVRFPGVYPISKGETLGDVLKRSGGVTEFADAEAAIFLRESLKEKEEQMLETIKVRLEKDVTEVTKSREEQLIQTKMLEKFDLAKPTGRLVIDLKNILKGDDRRDVKLLDGDQLVVPGQIQEVSILGEVNFPTSHMYLNSKSVSDYINLSGGTTRYSDRKRTYIVRKDGRVEPGYKKMLVFLKRPNRVYPGDSIVVPMDTDLTSPLDFWMGLSQVLFQLATTAAALDTVGAL